MTRVDFHFNAPDKLRYGCRLVRKIYRAHHKVLVWCDDAVRLAEFDRMLWTFSQHDFIPHVGAADPLAPETPVLLAAEPTETPFHEVLVNLGSATPPMFSRFDRLIEVVASDEGDREAARGRWRFYRDRGYPLERHDLASEAQGAG
ncbi:MAG: DNA polymerase III subunit chi [Burkholderiaceae bacterium]|nr:DNA polymerase III subunit chi [Burkholderiaceae bacterium]